MSRKPIIPRPGPSGNSVQRVGFVLYPRFQIIGFAAATVFEFANLCSKVPIYDVHFLSEKGGTVTASIGLKVKCEAFSRRSFDTLIVAGAARVEPASTGLLAYLRRRARTTRRLASICTGAFMLAAAGLLDGRRATTHWALAARLKSSYPKIQVEPDRIFIVDGPIWTAAGMSAGIDLALALLEDDHGADLARTVAKQLVVDHRRAGGQSQFSALLDMTPKSNRVKRALEYAKKNLRNNLSVFELAEAAHLSPRQLSRAFRAETGHSPAKAVDSLRAEAAKLMMEQGRLPAGVVASETGFADPERMRRAFIRLYGQSPQAIRRNARARQTATS
jgi:transcriptional regulator GlxA family with amidase domain